MNMTPKRSSFGTYLNNLVNGVTSMFEGMSITLASMFFRAQTIQYPDVNIHSNEELVKDYKGNLRGMPANYRGMLHVDMEICTACMICMKACPIDCIAITNVKCDKRTFVGVGGKKAVQTRAATRFDIDLGKCMFCGLCSLPCPTGAIHHTTQFEFVPDNLEALVYKFVTPQEAQKAEARAKEIEVEEKAAKAAKAKAEAEAKPAEPQPENN
ncbi:MAG: hypothetical protein A2600_03025 [Candidatus Lambdaproteobacteria bacterium RIFOXYD1_FULL_56_27]|uniref:4Fe-4S ferredoxin-type domain-containing protein n=1 Tax=Candidatus Lambdaproteobacteria bacterium RIFOXYD2_FULL_56_26 TaxID=1817773 RepID=A0A1F6H303_9PROT|nr:MAG: hypothetical protein A2557_07090 [Candidatus Lambdaproteobacteria bacterium RIFOXYD2_FULL_56_26]OGH05366.1 MAG: hypothetical protein A2426_05415 [Candidatus Lambdaproteobacteria bacterium RIFOXYC1_FULL_56_13]OGH09210.1 MAG: hypothetical protein A2600_03025 [Candidatus Lambdaproteobacteria bacterium RIFOXYD1_FULL_56_27]